MEMERTGFLVEMTTTVPFVMRVGVLEVLVSLSHLPNIKIVLRSVHPETRNKILEGMKYKTLEKTIISSA